MTLKIVTRLQKSDIHRRRDPYIPSVCLIYKSTDPNPMGQTDSPFVVACWVTHTD